MLSSAPPCNRCMSLTQHHIHRNRHKRHSWVIDSGASVHCVSDPSLLTSVYYKHHPVLIKVADNRTLHAHAVGTAILSLVDQYNRTHTVTLHNVIYHPNFHTNLLSVRRLWHDNHIMCRFDPHNYMQDASSGVRFPITFDKQYISSHTIYISSIRVIDDDIIHARFSHASERRRRHPFHAHNNPSKYKYFGARLSSDLYGPFPKSIDGYVYILNIVDASTNYLQVYFLLSKSRIEVQASLETFLRDFRSHLLHDHSHPIRWHTDH